MEIALSVLQARQGHKYPSLGKPEGGGASKASLGTLFQL